MTDDEIITFLKSGGEPTYGIHGRNAEVMELMQGLELRKLIVTQDASLSQETRRSAKWIGPKESSTVPNKKTYALKCGKLLILDITNPKPEEIDLPAVESRLRTMRRFSNNPDALTVHQHRHLVHALAEFCGETGSILDYCLHHDDPEAITGDIPGPLKNLIADHTSIFNYVEDMLDYAIHAARGALQPDTETRKVVHYYDKAAETIEWLYVLKWPAESWNKPMPPGLTVRKVKELLHNCRQVP